tara:strand:- start:791 stop:2320 length:1530 start_codon:yes stop_codon:yes gene_type:complete
MPLLGNLKIEPSFETFEKNYNEGKTQLIWTWIPSDLETPVSAYLKLCKKDPYCFLLESVEGGEKLGRYSFLGYDPDLLWAYENNQIELRREGEETIISNGDPIESMRALLDESKIDVVDEGMPPMAVSGLFGYVGYDMVRLIEDIPDSNPDDLGIPQSILMRPKIVVIFDSVKKMACLVTPVYMHAKNSEKTAQETFDKDLQIIQDAVNHLRVPKDLELLREESKLTTPLEVSSNMTKEQFKDAVQRVINYTHEGEAFQVVPSQRFSVDFDISSFAFYRTLRRVNPSPFMFHIAFDGFQLVGASPEILVRVRDRKITIRALAGTRKRGRNSKEDEALAKELLADKKECAEHLMLVDLGRNDVGRVSKFGSVKVTEKFIVEYYSHVMHIVSNIKGKLKDSVDVIDALFAGFPAGTLSGAPKVRAMEIIDEVEVSRRSYYAGGVGYFSGNGEMDTCIAIRTALIKDKKLYVQAGAGVVADSVPESEYQETINKSRALILAAELAIEESNQE